MISNFAETSQGVQRPKQEIAHEKLHVQLLHLSQHTYPDPFYPPYVSDQVSLMS